MKFESLDQALIGLSKKLLNEGVTRKTRGYDCVEIPEPVLVCLEKPCNRYITIPERKWNKFLPWIESLWLALGLNDLALPGKYVKNLYNFSDNGRTWRAGYGARFRFYTGFGQDYDISDRKQAHIYSGTVNMVDQFRYVIEVLKKDINSRQAIITIADPAKDCFDSEGNIKVTKDQPCSRSLQFMVVDGKLDCTLYIRSNDLMWGFSAVNVFNFTLIQEYFANILGIPVGKYYHFANNLHYYKNFENDIRFFASLNPDDYSFKHEFYYKSNFMSLKNFDFLIDLLFDFEKRISLNPKHDDEIPDFGNDMINDWARVIKVYWTKEKVEFVNPFLNLLFYGKENQNPDFKSLGFKPGQMIVKVYHSDTNIGYYSVFNPKGYIDRCEKDGKRAEYLGILKPDFTI